MLGKVLGVDTGEKKVGLAISDPTRTLARPLTILAWDADFWENLKKILVVEEIQKIVVGMPRGLRGDTAQTAFAKNFVTDLKNKTEVPVTTTTELFSTKIVRKQREHLKKSKRQQPDDAAAAAVFLQDFLDFKEKELDKKTTTN